MYGHGVGATRPNTAGMPLLSVALLAIIVISGCVGSNPDIKQLAKALPEVKQFLDQNPNADIKAILWDVGQVNASIDSIRADCGTQFKVGEYYMIEATDGNNRIVVWYDPKTNKAVCILRQGQPETLVHTNTASASISSDIESISLRYMPRWENGTNVRLNGMLNVSLWNQTEDENFNIVKGALLGSWSDVRIDDSHYTTNDRTVVLSRNGQIPYSGNAYDAVFVSVRFVSDSQEIFENEFSGSITNDCVDELSLSPSATIGKTGNVFTIQASFNPNDKDTNKPSAVVSSDDTVGEWAADFSDIVQFIITVNGKGGEAVCGTGHPDADGRFSCQIEDAGYVQYGVTYERTDCRGSSGSVGGSLV